ncbi:MAG: hypothetical protein OSB39_09275 [Opitutales bacterium]|nr:hypothetical protein [Opitutales bacterium]
MQGECHQYGGLPYATAGLPRQADALLAMTGRGVVGGWFVTV